MAKFDPVVEPEKKTEEQPAAVTTTPADEPKKEYVDVDSFRQFESRISGALEQLSGNFNALATNRPQVVQQGPAAVTDEELDAAVQSGEGGVAKLLNRKLAEVKDSLLREYIAPLQNTGMAAIAGLAETVTKKELPYYELLKGSIDKKLAMIDPSLRMDPKVIQHVYHATVGEPENLNKIIELAVEKKLRAGRDDDAATDASSTSSRKVGKVDEAPDAEAYFGGDAMQALRSKGIADPEAFVKRLGYKDMKSYIDMARKLEGGSDE